jgi:hypothetical protein
MIRPLPMLAVVVAAALLFLPGGALVIGYTLAALSLGVIVLLIAHVLYVTIDNWRLGRFPSSSRPAERHDHEVVDTREAA